MTNTIVMVMSRFALAAGVLAVIFALQTAGTAKAATCADELDRFERRLLSSTLAATDPDTFQSLVRRAEDAAELRDEEQCLQKVAELNAALPEDQGLQPTSRQHPRRERADTPDSRSRPAAPVLLIASDDEPVEETADEEAEGDAVAGNENGDNRADD